MKLMLDSTPNLLSRVSDGEIVYASLVVERMFGCEVRGGLVGRRVEELIPERLRSKHEEHRRDYANQPRCRSSAMGLGDEYQLLGLRYDQSEFPIEVLLYPLMLGGELHTMSIIIDRSSAT